MNISDQNTTDNTIPATDQGIAQFLAMNKTTGKFHDVMATTVMDIVCQYRAPAPCPDGFRWYYDASANEHGLSSCIQVFPADTHDDAASTCGQYSLNSPQIYQGITYNHLASYHNVTGSSSTPLIDFVMSLSALASVPPQGLYWTGALVQGGVVSWGDGRVFDCVVHNPLGYTTAQIQGDS